MCINSLSVIPNQITYNQRNTGTLSEQLISILSYRTPEKTARTFEAIIQFYFPFHGLSETDFLRFISILSFAEGTIYQIAEEYEAHIDVPHFVSQHLPVLRNVLTQLNLYDEELEAELRRGLIYYRLAQQLCSEVTLTEEKIALANRFKCFDCRFLHRLLYKLTAQPYDEEVLDLFWLVEQMSDIEDDIKHYNQDVEWNIYNTYRMFVRLYGSTTPQHLLRYLNDLQTQAKQRLEQLAKTRPEVAERMFELWNTYRSFHQMSVIPEPIIEKHKRIQ